jgi:plastocyanin
MMRSGRRVVFTAGIVGVLFALAACSGGNDAAPQTRATAVAVAISGFLFKPEMLHVAPGTTVTWANADDIAHTVNSGTPTSPSDAWPPSGDRTKGQIFTHTFEQAGNFLYYCANHNGMRGEIDVG